MGYREYLLEADKKFIDKIRNCKTKQEIIKVYCENFPNDPNNIFYDPSYKYYDEDDCPPPFRFGERIFEFGKYYENSNNVTNFGTPLFCDKEIADYYGDYNAYIIDKKGLKCAIDWQKEHITKMYEQLLEEKYEDPFDPLNLHPVSHLDRLKNHIDDYLMWWKTSDVVNLSDDKFCVANTWLYEHTIFNLVSIYKNFDWDNNYMIFMGW